MRDLNFEFCRIDGVKEGLHQYYELEQETDIFSLNTGRVMAKIGVNNRKEYPGKIDAVTFVIIDNKPHLNENGIDYLYHWVGKVLLVTTNKNHIAYSLQDKYDNLEILYYDTLDLKKLLEDYIKISDGNLRKLININEVFRQPNRKSLCIRGILSVYKRTNHTS